MVKRLLLIIAGGVLCIGGANCGDEILDDGLPFPEGIPDEEPVPNDGLPFPEGIPDEEPVPDDGLPFPEGIQDEEPVPNDGRPFPEGIQDEGQVPDDGLPLPEGIPDEGQVPDEGLPFPEGYPDEGLPFPEGYPGVKARTYVLKKGDDSNGRVGGVVEAIRQGSLPRPGPQSVFFCADLMVDANGVYTGGDCRLTDDETVALMRAIQDIIDLAAKESRAVEPGTEKHTLTFRLMFVFDSKPEDVIKLVEDYARENGQYKEENLGRISSMSNLRKWYGFKGSPWGENTHPSSMGALVQAPEVYGLNKPSSSSSSGSHKGSLPPRPPSSSSSNGSHKGSLPPRPPSSSSSNGSHKGSLPPCPPSSSSSSSDESQLDFD